MKVRLQSSEALGTTIRDIRNRLGKTLSEVAKAAGISKSYLSQIERGGVRNPTVELLGRIAKALKIELVIQGDPSRQLSEALTYQSSFTLQDNDEQETKRMALLELVATTLGDPKIPDHYKSLLERQITALVEALKEELQRGTLGKAGRTSQN